MRLVAITPELVPFWRARFLDALEWSARSVQCTAYDTDCWLTDPTSIWRIGVTEAGAVGMVGLQHIHTIDRTAEPVIALAPEHRCKGLGMRLAKLLISFAWNDLNMRRLQTAVLENALSRPLLEAAGFLQEGISYSARYSNGKFVDIVHYGLLRGGE